MRSSLKIVAVTALALVAGCGASIRPLPPNPGPVPVPAPATAPSEESGGTASVPAGAIDVAYFENNPLMVPVDGVTPSNVPDSFNEARDGGRTHRASDIIVPKGTRVIAAENGTILRLSRNTLGGITIYMSDDTGRYVFYYAHLEGYAAGLTAQEHVLQGQLLGYVGMTGDAPVPHLHFQAMVRDPGRRDYWESPALDVRTFFTIPGKVRETDEQ